MFLFGTQAGASGGMRENVPQAFAASLPPIINRKLHQKSAKGRRERQKVTYRSDWNFLVHISTSVTWMYSTASRGSEQC